MLPVIFPTAASFWLNYNPVIDVNNFSLQNRELANLPASFTPTVDKARWEAIAPIFQSHHPITIMSPEGDRKYYKNRWVKAFTGEIL